MSRLDNVEALEKQLADLQMSKDMNTSGRVKKIPPAVPPKKKAQPQVPHSAVVSTLREPSFSTKISPSNNNPPTYSNVPTNIRPIHKDYANVTPLSLPSYSLRNNVSLPARPYNPTYSNIAPYQNTDSLPPPPPPPPPLHLSSPLPSTLHLTSPPPPPPHHISPLPPPQHLIPPPLPPLHLTDPLPTHHIPTKYDTNQNTEEYLPPPSPVSSNYSELVRATTNLNYNQETPSYPVIYQNEYPEYGASQASTYESLYEPINPHPHGKTALQPQSQNFKASPNKSPLQKEEEVDALTNLLVQSISDSQDLDIFGICVKCDEKVVGESSGCTAMGNMYHVKCFCCYHCNIHLQGKPFYAVEGQPYCEVDYFETLEKCSVCDKAILDRILRATGKPYHPTCFTCVVCGKSLDGIPFTVDAMNQIHCIEDFHKKFAPRCCVCELPIMPEEGEEETVRVVALDRSFHVRCYRCEDCGLLLSSEAEGRGCYPLDDHILCKNCNTHRIRLLTNVMTTDL